MVLGSLPIVAKEYLPVLEQGKMWTLEYRGVNYVSTTVHKYGLGMERFSQRVDAEVVGDTLVDGRQCKVVRVHGFNNEMTSALDRDYVLSEEGATVSVRYETPEGEYVFIPVMSFDVARDDEIPLWDEFGQAMEDGATIEDVTEVVGFDGITRSKIVANETSWVEGVGFSRGY